MYTQWYFILPSFRFQVRYKAPNMMVTSCGIKTSMVSFTARLCASLCVLLFLGCGSTPELSHQAAVYADSLSNETTKFDHQDYLARLHADLGERLHGADVNLVFDGELVRMHIPSSAVFFEQGSEIQSDFYSVLNALAEVLAEFQDTHVRLSSFILDAEVHPESSQLNSARVANLRLFLVGRRVSAIRITQIDNKRFDNVVWSREQKGGKPFSYITIELFHHSQN